MDDLVELEVCAGNDEVLDTAATPECLTILQTLSIENLFCHFYSYNIACLLDRRLQYHGFGAA